MANQGAAEYDNPDWLKAKIDEQSNKFIADFRTVFEDGDPGNVEGALEINKDFDTADAYFDAIRMKFAGNLLEAVMATFFNHANVSDGRGKQICSYADRCAKLSEASQGTYGVLQQLQNLIAAGL